jgi:Ca2+-binding RTX toxin-like protein
MQVGGPSSDIMNGGSGNDMLEGGSGKDIFLCDEGVDTIADFDPGVDVKLRNCEVF